MDDLVSAAAGRAGREDLSDRTVEAVLLRSCLLEVDDMDSPRERRSCLAAIAA